MILRKPSGVKTTYRYVLSLLDSYAKTIQSYKTVPCILNKTVLLHGILTPQTAMLGGIPPTITVCGPFY